MDDDPDHVTVNAAWGSYQVPRSSFIAKFVDPERVAQRDAELIERGTMHWSLGTEMADLLWMLVPEARHVPWQTVRRVAVKGVAATSGGRPSMTSSCARWSGRVSTTC